MNRACRFGTRVILPKKTGVPRVAARLTGLLPAWCWALAALMAARVVASILVPVLPEEAYHWNFARHPDWSYFDHPPMLAWAIALGRLVLGDSAIGIRLFPLIFSLGTALLIVGMACRFYGERMALTVILLLALEPTMFIVPSWGFPDSPLLFFWALTLTLVWQALLTGEKRWWLAAGASLGCAMLSKYTAVFLVPSILAYLLASKRDRCWLATPWPYLAALVSIAVFTPVIYWNWTHDWASFRFQSADRFRAASGFEVGRGFHFIAEQWLGVVPLTFPIAAVAWWRPFRSARNEELFLFWTFTPMMAFFFVMGWTPSSHWLWPLPAYVALTIAMAGVLAEPQVPIARWWTKWRWRLIAVATALAALALIHAAFVLPWVPPLRETYGWNRVAQRAETLRATLGANSFYLGVGVRPYPCPSQLAFHTDDPGAVYGDNLIGFRSLAYAYWGEPRARLSGRDAVVVFEGEDRNGVAQAIIGAYFQSLDRPEILDVPISLIPFVPSPRVRFTLIRAHGYRALAHWMRPS
jgi:4-amino-4-deoxy-L-arabinose transferase-like glycosyltransferase